jgi:uncharacterized protein (DUF433 family)/DNA-binding transcriptional MerR regulator
MKRFPFAAAYPAGRAASLAGVPLSTLHYWSRHGIWAPSVSTIRPKRWSYADLLALRLIEWLRRDKPSVQVPRTSMAKIREALAVVEDMGQQLMDRSVTVRVDRRGGVVLRIREEVFVPLPRGLVQGLMELGGIDLVEAFAGHGGIVGPNLTQPRPTLRIIPGKLSGEPHVVDTRIPTFAVAALAASGLGPREVVALYPDLTPDNVEEAIDLEGQLERNLHPVAA